MTMLHRVEILIRLRRLLCAEDYLFSLVTCFCMVGIISGTAYGANADELAWVAAQAYAASSDSNGLREALYRSAIAAATKGTVTPSTVADFRSLSESIKNARTEADLGDLLSREVSRKYALHEAFEAAGRARGNVRDPRSVDARLATELVLRALGPSQQTSFAPLISNTSVNVAVHGLLDQIGQTLEGLPKNITPHTLKEFASQRGAAQLGELADSLENEASVGAASQRIASKAATTANSEVDAAVKKLKAGPPFGGPVPEVDFESLAALRGSASAALAVASLSGNAEAQKVAVTAVRVVDACVRLYVAAVSLYSGVGGYAAIVEIVQAYGDLKSMSSAEPSSPADVASANAQALFDYVRAQFIVVNAKLDEIISMMTAMQSSLVLIDAKLDVLDAKLDNLQRGVDDLATFLKASEFGNEARRLEQAEAKCVDFYRLSKTPGRLESVSDANDCYAEFEWLLVNASRRPLLTLDTEEALSLIPAGPEGLDAYYLGRSFAVIEQQGTLLVPDLTQPIMPAIVNPWLLTRGANGLALSAGDLGRSGRAQVQSLQADVQDAVAQVKNVKLALRTMQGGSETERRQIVERLYATYETAVSNTLAAWDNAKKSDLNNRLNGTIAATKRNLTTDGLWPVIRACTLVPGSQMVAYRSDMPQLSIPQTFRPHVAQEYRGVYRGFVSAKYRKQASTTQPGYTGPPLVRDLISPMQFCIDDHSSYVGINDCPSSGFAADCFDVDAVFNMTIYAVVDGTVLATAQLKTSRQRFKGFAQKTNYSSAVQWVGLGKGEVESVLGQILDSIGNELTTMQTHRTVEMYVTEQIRDDQIQALLEALEQGETDVLALGAAWSELQKSFKSLDRALALNRGYLAFTYPSLVRKNDLLRLMLAGNSRVRLLDSEGVRALASCISATSSPGLPNAVVPEADRAAARQADLNCQWTRLFVSSGAACQQVKLPAQKMAGACDIGGDPVERHFKQRTRMFKGTVASIAWKDEPVPSYPALDVAESRLQALLLESANWPHSH